MSNFTIKNLIQYFENRVLETDYVSTNAVANKGPEFPTLLIFVGEEAIKGFPRVGAGLFEVWPQYKQEIKCIGITKAQDNLNCYELSLQEDKRREPITKEGIGNIVESLFDPENHFTDKSKLFLYFITDTTSDVNINDFMDNVEIMKKVKAMLGIDDMDILSMLFVLLNEGITKKNIANQIKNELAGYYDNSEIFAGCNAIFLLSNRRNDNAILKKWDVCYRIVSSVIELSNSPDTNISGALFSKRILTSSYAREEKPSGKIGQIVVSELVDEMSNVFEPGNFNLFNDEELLAKRLGLTKERSIEILDDYAQSVLFPQLPDVSMLSLFPRKNMEDCGELELLSSREFNDLTMDAWEGYLSNIVRQMGKKSDVSRRDAWSKEYSMYLHNNFTVRELINLSDNIPKVRKIFGAMPPSQNLELFKFAQAKLRYELSSDPELIEVFIWVIQSEGERAKALLENWNSFIQSKQDIFRVKDVDMSNFYKIKVRAYLDYNSDKLKNELKNRKDMDSVKSFFEEKINDIIASDDIFLDTFENELNKRMDWQALNSNVGEYIRNKLTGPGVYRFLQVDFAFGAPVLSAIMVKFGTPLYESFISNLGEGIYYYNTGYGNAAESIVVYEVDKNNLIN